ncbi:MAG: ABC transporter ATP-binding protein [Kiritimatiellae bacterium]|jgi:ATP-binding cassette subfamily B protein|nr:ABC transporter ATP-binding protein [Kiritimatiellia bacterium]
MQKVDKKEKYTMFIKDICRVLALIWRSSRSWTIASMFLVVINGVLPLANIYLIKLVIDSVTDAAKATPDDQNSYFLKSAIYIGCMGLATILTALCRSLSEFIETAQSQCITDEVHDILHTKSLEVDLEYYENSEYYDQLHLAQKEAPYRPMRILRNIRSLIQSIISSAGVFAMLVVFNYWVAIIICVSLIPSFIVKSKFSNKQFRWRRRQSPKDRLSWYFNMILTWDEHAKEIRLFNNGKVFKERFHNVRTLLREEQIDIVRKRTIADLIAQIFSTVALFGCMAYVGKQTITGAIAVGSLVMYFQAFQRGQGFMSTILTSLTGLYENQLFLRNFYEFLALKPKLIDPIEPLQIPSEHEYSIEVDNLGFNYPSSKSTVLKNVSFKIKSGEHVAIVGENGAGKTTLIKLLCRLYDPVEGSIKFNGQDIRNYSIEDYRKQLSVVFQDYAKFNVSAKENIWYGNVDVDITSGRIEEAAKKSGADEVIKKLPHGYETILGKRFADGQDVSVGQWQKVAIARAFMRDSELLILDEPTSALDPKAEANIIDKFDELTKGKSAIIISHRLSTVKNVDRVFVISDGELAECGTHDELIEVDGIYAKLFELQARQYR